MRMKQVGNKREIMACVVFNVDTVQLNIGQAAFLQGLNGATIGGINADGLEVVGGINLGTNFASALTLPLLYGVMLQNVPANQYGEAQVFGFCPDIQFTQATRSASTASWTSWSSIPASFAALYPETLANGWTTNAGVSVITGGAASTSFNSGILLTQFPPPVVLGQSIASGAASASATSDTRTAITTMVKGFVRIL